MAALRLKALTASWCSLCGRMWIDAHTHTFTQRVRRENNQRGKQQRQNCRREITGGRTENKQLVHGLHVDASGFTPDQQFLHDGQFFMLTELNCAVCFLQNLFKPPLISVFPSPWCCVKWSQRLFYGKQEKRNRRREKSFVVVDFSVRFFSSSYESNSQVLHTNLWKIKCLFCNSVSHFIFKNNLLPHL